MRNAAAESTWIKKKAIDSDNFIDPMRLFNIPS